MKVTEERMITPIGFSNVTFVLLSDGYTHFYVHFMFYINKMFIFKMISKYAYFTVLFDGLNISCMHFLKLWQHYYCCPENMIAQL